MVIALPVGLFLDIKIDMKINKFRIWNYKSITDSQDCYPSKQVTILAGKNESGKTSILEALADFSTDKQIRDKAVPIQNEDLKPRIGIWFSVPSDDIKEILKTIGFLDGDEETDLKDVEVYVEKQYPNTYILGEETIKVLNLDQPVGINTEEIQNQVKAPLDTIAAIFNAHPELQGNVPPPMNAGNPEESIELFKKFKADIEPILPSIPDPDSKSLPIQIDQIIEILQKGVENRTYVDKFLKEFELYVPNFILFSSFNDIFPNTIDLDEIEGNSWIQDLEIISDLQPDTIKSNDDRKKKQHKTKINLEFNKEFKRFWVQDLAELSIDWDNQKLNFWIEENGYPYEPEIRSQGKRWYMAFYIRITARSKEDVRNVILIDEPGLYLHATAQKDVLNKLEEASKEAQIIFTTHSPYLIEADKLDRIRLIYRDLKSGTTVENKIHKVADKETLTPILTAIGLEMSNSISQIDRVRNVVVEGPSDYYYLQAFKNLYGSEDINYVFGGGSGNMPKVGTILQGWGCKVVYLYDSDQGLKNALKNIKREWITTTPELISKIPVDGAIEDIFSKSDYAKYILKQEKGLKFTSKNSEYAKTAKRDKVLDAKLFLESTSGSVILDKTSEANAKKILLELKSKFENEKEDKEK